MCCDNGLFLERIWSHFRDDHPCVVTAVPSRAKLAFFSGMPTVSKLEMSLQADHSVEYILKELQNAVPSVGSKAPLRVFKVLHYATLDSTTLSVPFYPCKPQPLVMAFVLFLSFSFVSVPQVCLLPYV